MLYGSKEVAIMANAKQKNQRNPLLSDDCFDNIFDDFFENNISFRDKKILDLGPGQWGFGDMVKRKGGICIGVDNDPAVIELGKHRGFECFDFNLKEIKWPKGYFDGVFVKYSVNAAWWADDPKAHETWIAGLMKCLRPDGSGWLWVAPWNGFENAETACFVQHREFDKHGCQAHFLTEWESKRYGIHGKTINRVIFTKGLEKK